ncbi:hypothetical protein ACFTWH_08545 [Streptomyces sp. NPDC057011]|uniref:hypothetical protein n=1 Tax=unclassified Streptomyces TaxID=2593676 RepID=UPI00362E8EA8
MTIELPAGVSMVDAFEMSFRAMGKRPREARVMAIGCFDPTQVTVEDLYAAIEADEAEVRDREHARQLEHARAQRTRLVEREARYEDPERQEAWREVREDLLADCDQRIRDLEQHC